MKDFVKRQLMAFSLMAVMVAGILMPAQTVCASSAASTAMAAEAAEVTALKTYKGNTKDFNAYIYYKNNIDIQTVIGADGDALLKHYNEYGKKEGRVAVDSATTTKVSETETNTKAATNKTNNSSSGYGFDTYDIPEQQNTEDTYVLNTSTMKIHHPTCKDVRKIKPSNYATSSLSTSELIAQGYSTCGHCFK